MISGIDHNLRRRLCEKHGRRRFCGQYSLVRGPRGVVTVLFHRSGESAGCDIRSGRRVMRRALACSRRFTEAADRRAMTLSIFAECPLLRRMTLSQRWAKPAGKSKKAVFDAKPSFFGGVTLSQKPKSLCSGREILDFLMSLIRKIRGLRKYLMSCRSEIYSLRKSHNVIPPEIC